MVGSVDVSSAGEARDLGVWLDLKLTMSTHVDKTCGAAFFYLYNIRHIRKFLSKESIETLIRSFITNCNSLFFSFPNHLMLMLQRKTQANACARLVYLVPKSCHVTPIPRDLHWLPVREIIR